MTRIRETFPHLAVYMDNADHVDIKTIEGNLDLRTFISGMLSYSPRWLMTLYHIREVLVRALGLVKHEIPENASSLDPENLSFTPGETALFFIVREARENAYWVSETPEDTHLKAYFGVVREALGDGESRYYVFTSVRYLRFTGPIYFNLIRPFHHFVVWRMMRAGISK